MSRFYFSVLLIFLILIGCESAPMFPAYIRSISPNGTFMHEDLYLNAESKISIKNRVAAVDGRISCVIFFHDRYFVFLGINKGQMFVLVPDGIDDFKITKELSFEGDPKQVVLPDSVVPN